MGRLALAIALFFAAFSTATTGATYWVHAYIGNDTYSGTSPDSALASLGAATTIMSYNDTCRAHGEFHETLTLTNSKHEGCVFRAWQDSSRWIIDGDTVRSCISIPSSFNNNFERIAEFRDMIALDGGGLVSGFYPVVNLGQSNHAVFKSCSLSTSKGGNSCAFLILDAEAIIESTVITSCRDGAVVNGYIELIASKIECERYCLYTYSSSSARLRLISRLNTYSGDYCIYSYYGADVDAANDAFIGKTTIFYNNNASRWRIVSSLLSGAKRGFHCSGGTGSASYCNIIHTTFDSLGCAFHGDMRTEATFMNTIISNCDTGLSYIAIPYAAGLDIFGASRDTLNLLMPITYYDFDPQLDSAKVARATLASSLGVSSFRGHQPPLRDDKGFWMLDEDGVPVMGWRSPNPHTEPPSSSPAQFWGIRHNGRRLK